MAGHGVEQRMTILRESANQQILKPLHTHRWETRISRESTDGEYIVITAEKGATSKSVALMYSSATANHHYKQLDGEVDAIFTNGALYHVESYAYGIKTPVTPIEEFFALLVIWNKELSPAKKEVLPPREVSTRSLVITAENPLDGVWAHLKQFSSSQISEKLIRRRADRDNVQLSDDAIRTKAEGVAYSVRNATDYLRTASPASLNRRILSLYYGSLALAFAEMLAAPSGPSDLDEVEGFTKFGHGLYTVPGDQGLGTIHVGGLISGFFPRWISFLGHDVSHFSRQKPKSAGDVQKLDNDSAITLGSLFGSLPELGNLFQTVFDEPPSWLSPSYDNQANPSPVGLWSTNSSATNSTYIHLTDTTNRITSDRIQRAPWPLAEIELTSDELEKRSFRARVDHQSIEYWHQALPIHRSPYCQTGALIFPMFGSISEYRAISFALLYALSIIVRYMPSAWRRIEGGDWDQYLALVETSVDIFDRLLPEQFLESITGERVHTRQPGSFL